jgi:desulfoferrodoxin ferrous iron-binding domain
MKKDITFYRCKHCGNLITFLNNSGAAVICCGEPMTKLEANSTDAATEKHVPVIQKMEDKVKAVIGSVSHPMLAEHYIEWIACVSDNRVEVQYLEPGQEPAAEFYGISSGSIYAYCNLHGLWKSDF